MSFAAFPADTPPSASGSRDNCHALLEARIQRHPRYTTYRVMPTDSGFRRFSGRNSATNRVTRCISQEVTGKRYDPHTGGTSIGCPSKVSVQSCGFAFVSGSNDHAYTPVRMGSSCRHVIADHARIDWRSRICNDPRSDLSENRVESCRWARRNLRRRIPTASARARPNAMAELAELPSLHEGTLDHARADFVRRSVARIPVDIVTTQSHREHRSSVRRRTDLQPTAAKMFSGPSALCRRQADDILREP